MVLYLILLTVLQIMEESVISEIGFKIINKVISIIVKLFKLLINNLKDQEFINLLEFQMEIMPECKINKELTEEELLLNSKESYLRKLLLKIQDLFNPDLKLKLPVLSWSDLDLKELKVEIILKGLFLLLYLQSEFKMLLFKEISEYLHLFRDNKEYQLLLWEDKSDLNQSDKLDLNPSEEKLELNLKSEEKLELKLLKDKWELNHKGKSELKLLSEVNIGLYSQQDLLKSEEQKLQDLLKFKEKSDLLMFVDPLKPL